MPEGPRQDFSIRQDTAMTYGGALSFLRCRRTRDVEGADIVVSGLPFDCATTLRPGARFGPAGLIHFDAHVDTWADDGERLDHGSMFLCAKREGLIDVAHSVQVGIRAYSESDHGFTILDAPWVHEHGPGAALKEILRVVGERKAYLTFDIDCLDPASAPGTGTPVASGLSSAQALAIMRGLGPLNIVGMDVVEVAPAYDHAEITAIAAATLAHDFIGLQALKKSQASKPLACPRTACR